MEDEVGVPMDATATSDRRRSTSYITLTPRSREETLTRSTSLAKDFVTRKWEAGKKKDVKEPRDGKETVGDARNRAARVSAKGDKTLESSTNDSPKETEQSSSESEVEEINSVESDDEELETESEPSNVLPTYVCELHDPKSMLQAEHVRTNRAEITLITAPKATESKDKRMWGWHSKHTFRYEISVGLARTAFDCTPSKVLDVLKQLARDKSVADQIGFIETNYFRNSFRGSIKRMYPSAAKLSDEIVEVLEAISDMDTVLLHHAYLQLIGVTKGTMFYKEIENLLSLHGNPPTSVAAEEEPKCMCDTYHKSVDRFGDVYRPKPEDANTPRFSVVASESLMWARSVLSFYNDTVYIMDKRDFRPWRGLNHCDIYGFGRRKLFEIERTSRKEWAFRHNNYGKLATLTIDRYMHNMNPYHMVTIKRLIPDLVNSGMREENICFVKKSKKLNGYQCMLVSEVISRGRVTTALSIEKAVSAPDDPHYHYVTMSEISGPARESICSSTLSVPTSHYKNCQHVHVSGGSDVVAFLAIAASYDILVGAWSYWKEKRY